MSISPKNTQKTGINTCESEQDMIDFTERSRYGFEDLVALVQKLRAPGGCEWDRAQTHLSIRRNFIEEVCEACEAIDEDDPDHLCEELGDVLLQVVFHASIEADAGRFAIGDVCDGVCKKLIERHPHLFRPGTARTDWETLKSALRGGQTTVQAMQGISKALPALWQADKILSKAERSGLYRIDPAALTEDVKAKLAEPTPEADPDTAAERIGEALFALTALAHCQGVDPEAALLRQCKQFIRGFSQLETAGEGTPSVPTHTK